MLNKIKGVPVNAIKCTPAEAAILLAKVLENRKPINIKELETFLQQWDKDYINVVKDIK